MTIEYTASGRRSARAILDNQVVHFRLAELETEVERCARSSIARSSEYINGADVTQLASMAKLKAGRLLREVTDGCLQYWGGMGYMTENEISRMYRDGRLDLHRRRRGRGHARHHLQGHGDFAGAEEEPLMPDLPASKRCCWSANGRTLHLTLNRPDARNGDQSGDGARAYRGRGLLAAAEATSVAVVRGGGRDVLRGRRHQGLSCWTMYQLRAAARGRSATALPSATASVRHVSNSN